MREIACAAFLFYVEGKMGKFTIALVVLGLLVAVSAVWATDYDTSVTAVGQGYITKPVYSNQSTAVTATNADTYSVAGWSGWTLTATGEGALGNYSGDLVVQGSADGTNYVTIATKTGDAGPQYLGSTRGTPWQKIRAYYTPDGVTGDITTIDVSLLLMKYKDN